MGGMPGQQFATNMPNMMGPGQFNTGMPNMMGGPN